MPGKALIYQRRRPKLRSSALRNAHPPCSAPPIRLLVVDDSPEFLDLAVHVLSAEPLIEIVGRATSGQAALEQTARLRPDLVLMDVAMPEMNGLEATRRIKARPESPRVVLLSLHDNSEYRAGAMAAGADGFLPKWELGLSLLSLICGLFDDLLDREQGRSAPPAGPVEEHRPFAAMDWACPSCSGQWKTAMKGA